MSENVETLDEQGPDDMQDEVSEELQPDPPHEITNVNHMLAKLLADNVVILSHATKENLIVPHVGLTQEGVFGYTPVDVSEFGIHLLYHMTRRDLSTGAAAWCLLGHDELHKSSETRKKLEDAGWNLSKIQGWSTFTAGLYNLDPNDGPALIKHLTVSENTGKGSNSVPNAGED